MDLQAQLSVIAYHKELAKKHGVSSARSLGWRNLESREKRFQALAQLGDFSRHSVLDLGCGTGDFKAFLDQHFQEVTYLGIELVPEFLEAGRERFRSQEKTTFIQADFTNCQLPQMDFIVASGAFSYHLAEKDQVLEVIQQLFGACKLGMAFNMLNQNTFQSNEVLTAYDRLEVESFCKTFSPQTEIIEGYLPDDFTVILRKALGTSLLFD